MSRRKGDKGAPSLIGLFLATVVVIVFFRLTGGTWQGVLDLRDEAKDLGHKCSSGQCISKDFWDKKGSVPSPGGGDWWKSKQTPSVSKPSEPHETAGEKGYDRGDYRHWIPQRSSCWNTREEVLYKYASSIVLLDKNGRETTDVNRACSIESGVWVDAYTDEKIMNPKLIDIDHIIPLAHAHELAGKNWDSATKQQYANDTKTVLYPTLAKYNRAKGAKGLDQWLPPTSKKLQCRYVTNYLKAASTYKIPLPQKETDVAKKVCK